MSNQYTSNVAKSVLMSALGSAAFGTGLPLIILGIFLFVCGIPVLMPHVFGGGILLFLGTYMLRRCDGEKWSAVLAMCVAFISFWVGVFIALRLVIHVPLF